MTEPTPLEEALPPEPAPDRFPWPPGGDESILTAFADTWRGASLDPSRFFRSMPSSGRLGPELLYYLAIGIAVAGATMFWSLLGLNLSTMAQLGGVQESGSALSPVIDFLLSPLILIFSLFLASGVTHLMLKLLGGARSGYSATARVFTYAYSPQVFGIIPWAGQAIGMVWMVVIAIIGLREVHGTSTGRAAAAVLIPFAVAVFFIAISMFILAASSVLLPQ